MSDFRLEMQLFSSFGGTSIPKTWSALKFMSSSGAVDNGTATALAPKWAQKTITIPSQRRGCHPITSKGADDRRKVERGYLADEIVTMHKGPRDPVEHMYGLSRNDIYLDVNLQRSSHAAAAGNATTLSYNPAEETLPSPEQSDPLDNLEATKSAGDEEEKSDRGDLEDYKITRVCDKLIEVFLFDKPTTTDWRKLLAFSKEWSTLRPHFFKRCQERAENDSDPGKKHNLLRLARKLKEVDEDIQRHNELLEVVRASPSEVSEVVARRRKDFTKEFFVHLHYVAESYYENPTEQNEFAKLGNMCLAAVQAYDTATESIEALNAAELKFQDIINSPSVDAACRKIDDLAAKNQLDSALVLMITKAWSAAKESNMTKDEVKDVLYHLYTTARGNLQRLMPKEIRILKYLLTIEDPEERMDALNDAFTPGDELEGKDMDSLYTTPEKLYTWIKTVLDAYNFSQEGTLIREARDMLNPQVIRKLEDLKKFIQDKFM